MKREGKLLEQIADPSNLRLAFWKAQRGKADKPEVKIYRKALDKNLYLLHQQILSGQVAVGDYHYFKVFDPKERQICAAAFGERVLHHALMNGCHANFERCQIENSFATRPGKGQYKALDRAKQFQAKYRWYLKLDVRKYFDSISHTILKAQLLRRFKEQKIHSIFHAIIDSYQVEAGKGLPIGNLTSQYFANHYLSAADHYIQEVLGVKGYVRYMDDMVLWGSHQKQLLAKGHQLAVFLEEKLGLLLKPFCLNTTPKPFPFLGYLLEGTTLRLTRRSRKRFSKRLLIYHNNLEQGLWDSGTYQRHVLPLIAFTRHARSYQFRKSCMLAIQQTGYD
jgi:hypothetical protein